MENKRKTLIVILAVVLAVSLPIAGYVVATTLLTSNHVSGVVNTVVLTLTANDTYVNQNDNLLLIAHLNDSRSGVSIQFFNGTFALNPTVLTNSTGYATVLYNVAQSTSYDLYAVATYP